MTPEMNLDEFSITELEDRLEFAEICNDNCRCQPDAPAPTTSTDGTQAA